MERLRRGENARASLPPARPVRPRAEAAAGGGRSRGEWPIAWTSCLPCRPTTTIIIVRAGDLGLPYHTSHLKGILPRLHLSTIAGVPRSRQPLTMSSPTAELVGLLSSKVPVHLLTADPYRQKQAILFLFLSLAIVRRASLELNLPWQESAERRRERHRLRNMTPLTTPQFEKESADLVSCFSRAKRDHCHRAGVEVVRGAGSCLAVRAKPRRPEPDPTRPLPRPRVQGELPIYSSLQAFSKSLIHDALLPQVNIRTIPDSTFAKHSKMFPPIPPGEKLGVNKSFLRQLRAILTIIIPR